MGFFANTYRWMIFKVGDIRWLGWKAFPFVVTWDPVYPTVKGDEVTTAIHRTQPGDVLVTRHDGYLSNRGIGGCMVHAALCVGGDHVIEAVSDDEGGVRRAHMIDVLQVDRALLLRPRINKEKILEDLSYIGRIVGCKYDVYFNFNSEMERILFDEDPEKARKTVRFCCTEVPHFAYVRHIDELELYRTVNPKPMAKFLRWLGFPIGESLITADMYVEAKFEIVWASKGCTVEWFKSLGASEKLLRRVELYWDKEHTGEEGKPC